MKESKYGIGVDIWSIGAVFLDLVFGTGKNRTGIFRGSTALEMVSVIHEIVGKEEEHNQYLRQENIHSVATRLRKVAESGNPGPTDRHDSTWLRIFGGEQNRSQWVGLNRQQRRALFWKVLEENIGRSGMDLVQRMLDLNPNKRIGCGEALKHPFFYENN
jgi:serine/threonine protein kinase